jgi:hypothetical protein
MPSALVLLTGTAMGGASCYPLCKGLEHMGVIMLSQAHRCWSIMDSIVCYGVWPLPLPSASHLRTATMPALTVTLSANGDGSALGASGVVGWVFGFDEMAVTFCIL